MLTIAELRSVVSITSLVISNSRRQILLNITPNAFPATRVTVKRDVGDDSPIDYIQVQTFIRNSPKSTPCTIG